MPVHEGRAGERRRRGIPNALRTYEDWTIHLEVDAVLRGQGMEPSAVRARSPRIVAAAQAAIAEGRPLLRTLVLAREFAITGHEAERVVLGEADLPCGRDIAARLAPAERLLVVGVTVGQAIDDHAVDAFQGDPMLALGLHGVGGAAVEDAAEQACRFFSRDGDVGAPGCATLCWPGSEQWPNDEAQLQIFRLLAPGEEAGGQIELTASRLIRPAKSLSFVVGLTSRPLTPDEACDTCGLIPVCDYRGC